MWLPQKILLFEARFESILRILLMNIGSSAPPVARMLTNGLAEKLFTRVSTMTDIKNSRVYLFDN